ARSRALAAATLVPAAVIAARRAAAVPTAPAALATTTAAAGRAVEHRQRAIEAAQHDLGRITVLPVLVLPLAGLELALDVDLAALAQVVLGDVDQPFGEDRAAVPLGPLLPLAGVAVLPLLAGRDAQVAYRAAVLELAHF